MNEKEFDFLYDFARKLVIKFDSNDQKALGSQWLKFLKESKNPLRNNYLKVFIMCAHNQTLTGLFADPPPQDLAYLKESTNLFEFGQKYLFTNYNTVVEDDQIASTFSEDKKEYAAVQTIPNLGVQLYYAISEFPLVQKDEFKKMEHRIKKKTQICPSID